MWIPAAWSPGTDWFDLESTPTTLMKPTRNSSETCALEVLPQFRWYQIISSENSWPEAVQMSPAQTHVWSSKASEHSSTASSAYSPTLSIKFSMEWKKGMTVYQQNISKTWLAHTKFLLDACVPNISPKYRSLPNTLRIIAESLFVALCCLIWLFNWYLNIEINLRLFLR